MKKLILLIFIALIGIGVYFNIPQNVDAETTVASTPKPVPIETVKVTSGDLRREFTYSGTVEADYQVAIAPNVSGIIQYIQVTEGEKVSRGTLLAKIDHNQLSAKLATLDAKQGTAEINLTFWQEKHEKFEQLYRQGAISEQQYSEVDLQFKLAQNQVKEISTNISEIKTNIKDFYVRAPRSAVVSHIQAAQGETALPGRPLMILIGEGAYKITVPVAQSDLTLITIGTQANAVIGEKRLELEVTKVLPSLDPQSNTAIVELECSDDELASGMAAQISFIAEEKKDVLVVPVGAVVEKDGAQWVYVIDGDTARLKAITTGISDTEKIQIVVGLEEGDIIAIGASNRLQDGDLIYPIGGEK